MPAVFSRSSTRYYVAAGLLLGVFSLSSWIVLRSEAAAEARAFYSKGDLRNALRRSLDHLDRRPWDREATLLAALCLSRLDYAGMAEVYYRKHDTISSLTPDQAHIRAYGLTRGNEREAAVAAYRAILSVRPDDPVALQRLATLYLSMTRFPDALEFANRLAQIPAKEVVGYSLIGSIAHQDAVPEDSSAAYEKVLALDPELKQLPIPRSMFWSDLIGDLLESGRPVDARRYLEAARRDSPRDPKLTELEGRVVFQAGDIAGAEELWKKATQSDPSMPFPWLGLGRISLERGDLAEAKRQLARASTIDPTDPEPVYLLSQAERREGRVDQANQTLRRSEDLRAKKKMPARGMGAP